MNSLSSQQNNIGHPQPSPTGYITSQQVSTTQAQPLSSNNDLEEQGKCIEPLKVRANNGQFSRRRSTQILQNNLLDDESEGRQGQPPQEEQSQREQPQESINKTPGKSHGQSQSHQNMNSTFTSMNLQDVKSQPQAMGGAPPISAPFINEHQTPPSNMPSFPPMQVPQYGHSRSMQQHIDVAPPFGAPEATPPPGFNLNRSPEATPPPGFNFNRMMNMQFTSPPQASFPSPGQSPSHCGRSSFSNQRPQFEQPHFGMQFQWQPQNNQAPLRAHSSVNHQITHPPNQNPIRSSFPQQQQYQQPRMDHFVQSPLHHHNQKQAQQMTTHQHHPAMQQFQGRRSSPNQPNNYIGPSQNVDFHFTSPPILNSHAKPQSQVQYGQSGPQQSYSRSNNRQERQRQDYEHHRDNQKSDLNLTQKHPPSVEGTGFGPKQGCVLNKQQLFDNRFQHYQQTQQRSFRTATSQKKDNSLEGTTTSIILDKVSSDSTFNASVQISPKFPSTEHNPNDNSRDNRDNAGDTSQILYSDINVTQGGYIPAAGVGVANQMFSKSQVNARRLALSKSSNLDSHLTPKTSIMMLASTHKNSQLLLQNEGPEEKKQGIEEGASESNMQLQYSNKKDKESNVSFSLRRSYSNSQKRSREKSDGVPTQKLEDSGEGNEPSQAEIDQRLQRLQSSWLNHRRQSPSDNSQMSSQHHANLAKNYKQHRLKFSGIKVRLSEVQNNRSQRLKRLAAAAR